MRTVPLGGGRVGVLLARGAVEDGPARPAAVLISQLVGVVGLGLGVVGVVEAQEGCRYQMQGELDRAIERYRRAIEVHPTAEAYAFLGWALSFQGKLDEATEKCRRAIEIDPDFGNPYNDIGVYLMQQETFDEAIPWLEKAKLAKRYEPRQFPFMNLGRIYLRQGRWWEALREFEGAVRTAPDDVGARKALHAVRARLN